MLGAQKNHKESLMQSNTTVQGIEGVHTRDDALAWRLVAGHTMAQDSVMWLIPELGSGRITGNL